MLLVSDSLSKREREREACHKKTINYLVGVGLKILRFVCIFFFHYLDKEDSSKRCR